MASHGTKHGLRQAIISHENHSMRKYVRDLVQEDGPLRTERLLTKMAAHETLPQDGLDKALKVLAEEARANQRINQRRFPDTWQYR